MEHDALIVGAGVAGLSAARALREQGASVTVVDRARGVGGRCATRRVDGQPVDHGAAFLHGRDEGFLAAVSALEDATLIERWPARVVGSGLPCQPDAFDHAARRFACRDGISSFPKRLASGLDVRLSVEVLGLKRAPAGLGAVLATGEEVVARTMVLAMPVPQALPLLAPLVEGEERLARILTVLGTVRYASCLTLIAQFPRDTPPPQWDAAYPERTQALHAVFHDSGKRAAAPAPTLVLQARAAFSRASMAESEESWGRRLLEEAATIPGGPLPPAERVQYHVWRHARVHRATELAAPLVVGLPGGARLAMCGDAFHPGGGVEAAYASGLALAERLAAA